MNFAEFWHTVQRSGSTYAFLHSRARGQASLQSMAELDEISRVQGIKWGMHGVHI